jgi:hypothetical protein
MMLFNVVATLGGEIVPTLCLGATALKVGRSTVGGVNRCPAMIAVSCHMAWTCLSFLAIDDGTLPPRVLRNSGAAAMERS